MPTEPRNPSYRSVVERLFGVAPFIQDLGIRLADVGPGWCETALAIQARHKQQNDFIHAGVQATMADHTAGGAATSLVAEGEYVLTVEFKINLLRPAGGARLTCRSAVLKAGRTLSVVESDVFAYSSEQPVLAARATVTLAVLR